MTDGKILFFNPIQSNSNAPYKLFTTVEDMVSSLLISIYDTPASSEKLPLVTKPITNGNGIIDGEEFKDTKKEYEKKIEKIRQYCKEYGQDISRLNIPEYEYFSDLCNSPLDAEKLAAVIRPKKSLKDEIGLGDMSYVLSEYSVKNESEDRVYEDGTSVKIYFYMGSPKEITLESKNKEMHKVFDITGNIMNSYITDKEKQIHEIRWYHLGNLISYKKIDLISDEILERVSYDKYGNRLLNNNQKLANELIKDLTNKNILGITSVRKSLLENLGKIDSENIIEICEEYQRTTGRTLIKDIENASISINTFQDIFKSKDETTSQKLINDIRQKYIEAFKDKKINDMQRFLANTGLEEELFEYVSDDEDYCNIASFWLEETGRDTFEGDFINSNLPTKEKFMIQRMITTEARSYNNFDVKKQEITNQRISHPGLYESEYTYDLKFNGFAYVDIKNLTTGVTRRLDLIKLTSKMTPIDRNYFLSEIQSYPAEVLEDMAIELMKVTGHSGNEYDIRRSGCDGYYRRDEKVVFNSNNKNTNIHEMGHAIDWTYLDDDNSNMSAKGSFYKTFQEDFKGRSFWITKKT